MNMIPNPKAARSNRAGVTTFSPETKNSKLKAPSDVSSLLLLV